MCGGVLSTGWCQFCFFQLKKQLEMFFIRWFFIRDDNFLSLIRQTVKNSLQKWRHLNYKKGRVRTIVVCVNFDLRDKTGNFLFLWGHHPPRLVKAQSIKRQSGGTGSKTFPPYQISVSFFYVQSQTKKLSHPCFSWSRLSVKKLECIGIFLSVWTFALVKVSLSWGVFLNWNE